MAGLYIHIPFCESRCIYCGFYSTTTLSLRDKYVDAICREMQLRPITPYIGEGEKISTIYLGGGTPSQLTNHQIIRIFNGIQQAYSNHIAPIEDMEITVECNPDDITEDFCKTISQLPINRISMGVQTFQDSRLRFLHRRHNASDIPTAIKRLRNIGIHNISIDLMFGFPQETLEEWEYDILQALNLGVEHISAYSLMYEEGTVLYQLLQQQKCKDIDEELSRKMYDTLIDTLRQAGYEHYEISNFALPGYYSRHNSSYWHETPYIGIGAAAHSYNKNTRSWNIADIRKYMDSILLAEKLPAEIETLDINTRYNDLITTALRTKEGINLPKMRKEYGEKLFKQLMKDAQQEIERGLMKNSGTHLSLTREGLYISDDIMSNFMIV